MILTTHALTGAVIGKNIANPWVIIPVSLAVHYLMDGIRHAEYFDARVAKIKDTWWKIALDLLIGGIFIFSFIFIKTPDAETIKDMALGIFFSLLPDGITLIYYLSGRKLFVRLKNLHTIAHHYDKIPKYSPERQWSLLNARNDIIISAIAFVFLFL